MALLFPLLVKGQEYRVESFENVPSDLTARTESRVDNNGRKCGLIKVYVKDAITATGGPVVGDVVDRGMEKWVYVAHDAKKIQLLFKEHMPLYVTFDDYNYPTITGQMTYILKLKEDEVSHASVSNQGHPSDTTNGLIVSQQQNQENIVLTPEEMLEKGKVAQFKNMADYDAAFFQGNSGYQTTPSGLKLVVVVPGTGASPKATDIVTVHYTGRMLDGSVFDSSVEQGLPTSFLLQACISGLIEGLQLMQVGGQCVFYVPSNLAYGEMGTPGGPIGPNKDLIFEVELLGIEGVGSEGL
ncbi:MAG: FKBP-type peptidyl-prolyl cis-trans isomerase [Muribaculaceae bacterium]|nr:FKBP-type peptidyl-prolyl cis-trans isomerase [Muribaculaceae bacterium]